MQWISGFGILVRILCLGVYNSTLHSASYPHTWWWSPRYLAAVSALPALKHLSLDDAEPTQQNPILKRASLLLKRDTSSSLMILQSFLPHTV